VSASIHQLAAAVAVAINAGSYTESVSAEARYVVRWELRDLADLKVSVVPRTIEREIETRTSDRRSLTVDVALQQRCVPTNTDRVAELIGLLEQIEAELNRQRLALADSGAVGAWVGSQLDPVYLADELHQQRVFTGVLTLTYHVWEDA
jgi:hypothetical protein